MIRDESFFGPGDPADALPFDFDAFSIANGTSSSNSISEALIPIRCRPDVGRVDWFES